MSPVWEGPEYRPQIVGLLLDGDPEQGPPQVMETAILRDPGTPTRLTMLLILYRCNAASRRPCEVARACQMQVGKRLMPRAAYGFMTFMKPPRSPFFSKSFIPTRQRPKATDSIRTALNCLAEASEGRRPEPQLLKCLTLPSSN